MGAQLIFGLGLRYSLSAYLVLVVLLIAAIVNVMPALRMQISDDGPYLTKLSIEGDGLSVDRKVMKAKYLWAGLFADRDLCAFKNMAVSMPIARRSRQSTLANRRTSSRRGIEPINFR